MHVWANLNLSKLNDPGYATHRQEWLTNFLKEHTPPINPNNPPKIAKTTWSWLHAIEELALWRWLQSDSIKVLDLLDLRVATFHEHNLPDTKAELSRMSPWPATYPYNYTEVDLQRITNYRVNFHKHWLPAIVARTPQNQHRELLLELLTAPLIAITQECEPDTFAPTFQELFRDPDQEIALAILDEARYTYLRIETLTKWSPSLGQEVAATLAFFNDEIGMELRKNGYIPVINKYKGVPTPTDISNIIIEM